MGDNIAQQNNLHVFAGVLHCFVTTPKEVKDGIEEYHRNDRKCQSTALGTEQIGKLLMQYAVPAIIAMTASSLYNMVDFVPV